MSICKEPHQRKNHQIWLKKRIMQLSLQCAGEGSPTSYSTADFEALMGIHYTPHLLFQTPRVEKQIRKLCQTQIIESRQKWLGVYYAQEILSPPSLNYTIAWIQEEIGYGVITQETLPKNTFIGEYTGIVRKKRFFGRWSNSYCFDYTIDLEEDARFVIDAKTHGNFTRYINHSQSGNLDTVSILSGGVIHIVLISNREIPIGSQLTYDYGENFWEKRKKPI